MSSGRIVSLSRAKLLRSHTTPVSAPCNDYRPEKFPQPSLALSRVYTVPAFPGRSQTTTRRKSKRGFTSLREREIEEACQKRARHRLLREQNCARSVKLKINSSGNYRDLTKWFSSPNKFKFVIKILHETSRRISEDEASEC